MALEVITKFLPVNDDMDFYTKLNSDIANNNVKVFAQS